MSQYHCTPLKARGERAQDTHGTLSKAQSHAMWVCVSSDAPDRMVLVDETKQGTSHFTNGLAKPSYYGFLAFSQRVAMTLRRVI